MKAINMFNARTGEIKPLPPDFDYPTYWLKMWGAWQPQYDINNQYMGYKNDCGEFRDTRN